MRRIVISAFALVCAVSCLEVNYYESEEVLEVDRSTIDIVSEKDLGDDVSSSDQTIYDTVYVTSNRSFRAAVEPAVEWAGVVCDESVNLSGMTRRVPVVLAVARNRKDVAREASLVVYGEGAKISVPISQNAPVYYVRTSVDKDNVLGVRDTCVLKVRSNTKWTASLDKALTTAEVSLTKVAGRDNGSLQVCFAMNKDFDNTKKAVVVIEGEGCEAAKVEITQNDGSPFVTFLESDFREAPESHYIPVSVTANVPWTIDVEQSTFVNARIITVESYLAHSTEPSKWVDVAEGDYVEGLKLAYIADHGADPTVDKAATLVVKTKDGTSTGKITVKQKGCIHLDFLNIDPEAAGTSKPYKDCYDETNWPFFYPSYTEMCFTWNGCMLDPVRYPFDGHVYGEIETELKCGYKMPVRTNGYEGDVAVTLGGGFWYQKNSKGLQLSYCINGYDYIKTPIVPGMALKRLVFEASPFGVNTAYIREAGSSTDALTLPDLVPNAQKWQYVNSQTTYVEHEPGYTFEHVFETPEVGTAYRLSFEQTKCCTSIKELVFIYE